MTKGAVVRRMAKREPSFAGKIRLPTSPPTQAGSVPVRLPERQQAKL
jgi:hypothetical protein